MPPSGKGQELSGDSIQKLSTLPELKIVLCAPRGFCAGVDRAIQIVELALEKYGSPVYVRHEIVHNRYVVESLKRKGAVFVEELAQIADSGRPVIFSAHGVPRSVPEEARARGMFYVDATCPLVSKVHREALTHAKKGHEIVLVGHAGHPEVIGTMGQVSEGAVTLIETLEDAENFIPRCPDSLAWVTQTTLSVDDTREIVACLQRRFPGIVGPHKEDICYATTNRQEAVKEVAPQLEALLVVGAPNSSNAQRLCEVAQQAGCPQVHLVQGAEEIPWDTLGALTSLGITAGASAPEILVEGILDAFAERYQLEVTQLRKTEETVVFNLPAILRPDQPVGI